MGDYWEDRALQNALKSEKEINNQARLVTKHFEDAWRELSKTIDKYYSDNKHEVPLKKYSREVVRDYESIQITLDEYIKLGDVYAYTDSMKAVIDKLRNNEPIRREDFLIAQLDLILNEVYFKHDEITTDTLTKQYETAYYTHIYDIQQHNNKYSNFNRLSTNQIISAVTTNWSGKNYSEIIWEYRDKLSSEVEKIVTTSMINGTSSNKMVQQLKLKMNTSAYNARRIIRTESNYVTGVANHKSYKDNGTEKYIVIATLDVHTSQKCRKMDGKVFNVEDAKVGVTMNPFHVQCRTTTAPHNDDNDYEDETRVARGADGNTYDVPANMTYEEWYKKYIEGDEKQSIIAKKIENYYKDEKQFEKYKDRLGKEKGVPKTLDEWQTLKYTDSNGYDELKGYYKYKGSNENAKFDDYRMYRELKPLFKRQAIINVPPRPININELWFDDEHINGLRSNGIRKHYVTREEAEQYIIDAKASVTIWNGQCTNYFSHEGHTYTNKNLVTNEEFIRTSYKRHEFDELSKKIDEVISKYER